MECTRCFRPLRSRPRNNRPCGGHGSPGIHLAVISASASRAHRQWPTLGPHYPGKLDLSYCDHHSRCHSCLPWLPNGHLHWHDCLSSDRKKWHTYELGPSHLNDWAVSTSPYNLVSRKTLTTPFAIAIGLAVILTGVSNFTSTALLIDFRNTNITTPRQTIEMLYGSSQFEEANGTGTSTDLTGSSGFGTLKGSKVWNSQPNTYFRFAEQFNGSVPDTSVDSVENSGTSLRAILPFANVADRTNLRGYEGPSVVFDSRVVCAQPRLEGISFSTVVSNEVRSSLKTSKRVGRGNDRSNVFDDFIVGGTFIIPKGSPPL